MRWTLSSIPRAPADTHIHTSSHTLSKQSKRMAGAVACSPSRSKAAIPRPLWKARVGGECGLPGACSVVMMVVVIMVDVVVSWLSSEADPVSSLSPLSCGLPGLLSSGACAGSGLFRSVVTSVVKGTICSGAGAVGCSGSPGTRGFGVAEAGDPSLCRVVGVARGLSCLRAELSCFRDGRTFLRAGVCGTLPSSGSAGGNDPSSISSAFWDGRGPGAADVTPSSMLLSSEVEGRR